jgi:hypothetical protein
MPKEGCSIQKAALKIKIGRELLISSQKPQPKGVRLEREI